MPDGDENSPNGKDYRLWRELSDLRAQAAATTATLTAIQNELGAGRDRMHTLNNSLQAITLQLSPIVQTVPTMQKQIGDFNDLKNKGYGILIAASAAGAIIIEAIRYLIGLVIPPHQP